MFGLKIVTIATTKPPSPPMSAAGIRIPTLPLATAVQVKLAEKIVSSTSTSDLVDVPCTVIAGSLTPTRMPVNVPSLSAGLAERRGDGMKKRCLGGSDYLCRDGTGAVSVVTRLSRK